MHLAPTHTAIDVIADDQDATLDTVDGAEIHSTAPGPIPASAPSPLQLIVHAAVAAAKNRGGRPVTLSLSEVSNKCFWKCKVAGCTRVGRSGPTGHGNHMRTDHPEHYTGPAASGLVADLVCPACFCPHAREQYPHLVQQPHAVTYKQTGGACMHMFAQWLPIGWSAGGHWC